LCLLLGKDMTLSLSYVSCSSLKHNKFPPSTMIMAKVELQVGVELLVTRIHSLMLRNEVTDASTAEPWANIAAASGPTWSICLRLTAGHATGKYDRILDFLTFVQRF
jgi:hypothetical protein